MIIKRIFIFTLIFFTCIVYSYSQDTLYHNVKGESVKSLNEVHHYTVTTPDSVPHTSIVREYSAAHILKSEKHYLNHIDTVGDTRFRYLRGITKEWYDNGQLYKKDDTNRTKGVGTFSLYWENGQLKRQDNYKNGKFTGGNCFNLSGKKIKYFPYETNAEYRNGNYDLASFLSRNLEYPIEMKRSGLQKRVFVLFTVTKEGKITNVHIRLSENEVPDLFDIEAIRVVKLVTDMKPKLIDGEPTDSELCFPVIFTLNTNSSSAW